MRVCGIPPRSAHTQQWSLPDLAAIARIYIKNAKLDLVVQAVRFTGSGNTTSDHFRREIERHHLAAKETLLMAYQPAIAHSAPELVSACDYALVSFVDIAAGKIELLDMNAKTNCERWTCKHKSMFDAPGAKSKTLPVECFGMLRICR